MCMNSSAPLRVGLIPILVFSLLHPANAAIRPSFSLDYCSWHATDIALVEVTPRPGVFRVMESWKGDLARKSCRRPRASTRHWRDGDCCLPQRVRRNVERWTKRTNTCTACWLAYGSIPEKGSGSIERAVGARRFRRRNKNFCCVDRWRTALPIPTRDESRTKHSRALGYEARQNGTTREGNSSYST